MEKVADRIALSGNLDRQSAEALRLELQRLARRHGITVKSTRVEHVDHGQEVRTGR
ncbi:MAG TPA: hypothetical protein VK548_06735 [Candidatus Acidoferrum sp.]|nr:hypothetical protein [Candidatus Acidoferrum sp.]